MEEKRDSSTHIDGPVTNSPTLSGEFHERVTINIGQQQQVAEKASTELKRPPKPSRFHGESNIFVGRQQDITKIKQYLNESRNAPISIVGGGGIGKSALAFKAIHECEDMFDIVIPVYFESVLTFNSFLLEMAKSLQLPTTMEQFERLENIQDKADVIKDALSRYRRVLVYTDNYETIRNSIINKSSHAQQLNPEEDAIKINKFLKGVPTNTSVVLTSQQRQNLSGERVLQLEGLSIEDGRDLFIEVAGEKLPKQIPIQIKDTIEEISNKTGGHPLSIEILASTYTEILLPELRDMLVHVGAGLDNPEEREGSRHKSLEASFEYSITKLPETHRLLLLKLPVIFKSPFPASAVEYIFGSGDGDRSTEALIRDLHNSSLLRRIDFDEYGDYEGKYRLYHFHPSVRNYLEHKVHQENKQQKKQEKYSEQFSLYYGKLIGETYNAIGTKDHVLSLERFNVIWQEKDNDFDRAIRLAKDRSVASAILSYLGLILFTLGRYSAALEYHNKVLSIDEKLQNRSEMAMDYNNIGAVFFRQGNYDQALEYHKKSLAVREKLNDKWGMAGAYRNIGLVLKDQGNYDQALQYLNNALAIHKRLPDRLERAIDYRNIGLVLKDQGHYDQALEYHKKALKIFEELQNAVGMAIDYANIGLVLKDQGHYDQALEFDKKALEIDKELKDRVRIPRDYANIGLVLKDQGHYDQALEYEKKALAIQEELQDRVGMAIDYANIGLVLKDQGHYDQALQFHNKALTIHKELNDRVRTAKDYLNIGDVLSQIGEHKAAIESFSKGLAILQQLEQTTGYHDPLSDRIQHSITQLQKER